MVATRGGGNQWYGMYCRSKRVEAGFFIALISGWPMVFISGAGSGSLGQKVDLVSRHGRSIKYSCCQNLHVREGGEEKDRGMQLSQIVDLLRGHLIC